MAIVQVQEEQRLLDVRTTGHFVYLQNTCVDRARHLLSLTHCATFGPELRDDAFSCSLMFRSNVLAPARLYPLPFMLVGACMIYFIKELYDQDTTENGSNFLDGSVACVVPDMLASGKIGHCKDNRFFQLLLAIAVLLALLAFVWDSIAVHTIRAIRLSSIRPLCFIMVPPEVIPDAMNDIIEIDIANDQQLHAIGQIDDTTAIAVAARNRQIHTFKVNIYDLNFNRRYFAPWITYLLFGSFLPFCLLVFFAISQHEPGTSGWQTAEFSMWLRRVALFAWAIRGVGEALRFLLWLKNFIFN